MKVEKFPTRNYFLCCVLAFLLQIGLACGGETTQVYAAIAGKAELVTGTVTISSRGGKARPLNVGDVVLEGDTVDTGNPGEAHLRLDDHGALAIRPNTRLLVVQYKAEGGDQDGMVLSLVKGAFRGVSGWIGKYNRKAYVVRTPNSTIGIRGTDFEVIVVPRGVAKKKAGTYSRVYSGAIFLASARGIVEILPGGAAFADTLGRAVPRLLKDIPDLFRAYDTDGKFEKMAHDLAGTFEKARGERERVVRRLGADFNRWRNEQEQRRYDPIQDLKDFIDRRTRPPAGP